MIVDNHNDEVKMEATIQLEAACAEISDITLDLMKANEKKEHALAALHCPHHEWEEVSLDSGLRVEVCKHCHWTRYV